jgi:predicted thioesterase
MSLEPGMEREEPFVAEGRLLTDVGGTIGVSVLSTPGLIGMMERNCAMLALEHLPEGKATVGFEVCIKHVAGAVEGAACTARAKLREVVDGRKLRFDVEVLEGERTLGIGTHERRVIDVPTTPRPRAARAGRPPAARPSGADRSARPRRVTGSACTTRSGPSRSRPSR